MTQELSLKLQNICARYAKHELISGLSGCFKSGALNLILGRAGSGKTTLLRLIAGFHSDFSGQIFLNDEKFKSQGNLSLAFQDPETLFFTGSVAEEVGFALRARKFPDEAVEEKVALWLKRWGLDPARYLHKHPLELSGGEKRRVALAACTVFMPAVILLDEPLAGLDASGQQDLAKLLSEISHDHIVVVVTHDPEILLPDSNEILFLRQNGPEWHTPQTFLASALDDEDFYPLPEWYFRMVEPYKHLPDLPPMNARSTFEFINRQIKK